VAEAGTTGDRIAEALRAFAELEALPGQRRHPQIVELRRRLAARCRRGALRSAWPLQLLTGHNGNVDSVAFSPDGKFAVSGSFDKTLRLWEVATGRCLRRFEGHTSEVIGRVLTGRQARFVGQLGQDPAVVGRGDRPVFPQLRGSP
jgi:hypothetical protein